MFPNLVTEDLVNWLIISLLLVILIVVGRLSHIRTLLNDSALLPLADTLDRVESKLNALHEEIDTLNDKIKQIGDAVGWCDNSITHLDKRFNRIDPYYRQEVDPYGLLDEETLFGLKKPNKDQ